MQLANLDLVICSESIEVVSISGSYRLQDNSQTTMLRRYAKRSPALYTLGLDGYFHHVKNQHGTNKKTIIPHYVGGQSQPKYPVTEGYARAAFIIHKPWHDGQEAYDRSSSAVKQFEALIRQKDCPAMIKLPYERMRWRFLEKLEHREPIAKEMDETAPRDVDQDIVEMLEIASTFYAPDDEDMMKQYNFDLGHDFNWNMSLIQVSSCGIRAIYVQVISFSHDKYGLIYLNTERYRHVR